MGRCFLICLLQCQSIGFTCELYESKCKTAMDKIQERTSIKTQNMKHIRVVSLFVTNHLSSLITLGTPLDHLCLFWESVSSNFITYSIKVKCILSILFEVLLINFLEYFSFEVHVLIRKHIRWPRIRAIHIRWFCTNLSYDNLC